MTTMTANRLSTHGPKVGEHVCTYKGCDKSFGTPQGLAMHVGRVHTHKIRTATSREVSRGLQVARNGKATRGKLTKDQKAALCTFIAAKHGEYPTKQAVFVAALEHAGATGVIQPGSTAVDRYFKKAMRLGKPAKRKYTKRSKVEAVVVSEYDCIITGPGIRVEWSNARQPTILASAFVALAQSFAKGRH